MKISKLILIAVLGMFYGCDSSNGLTNITVQTDITAPEAGLVVLYSLQEGQMKAADTLELDGSNYKTSLNVTAETFYRLAIFNQQYSNLILDGSESNVEVKFDGSAMTITGSKNSLVVQQIDESVAKLRRDMQQLSQEAGQANQNGDQETVDAIVVQYNSLQRKNESQLKDIIRASSPSLASVYGLNFLDMTTSYSFFDSVATATFNYLPNDFLVKQVKGRVDNARSLTVGQMAPDFELPDPEGVGIALSDLRGRYVLIDFWAAWCKPCRAENPNVVRMYEKYGGREFEILGVSLDRTKGAWLKAIADDGLEWVHVSDLKYFNSAAATLYNINAIPATFLIDPEGKIIGKNLRGPTLEAKLEELFGTES